MIFEYVLICFDQKQKKNKMKCQSYEESNEKPHEFTQNVGNVGMLIYDVKVGLWPK